MVQSERIDAGRILLGAARRSRGLHEGWTLAETPQRAGLPMTYLSEVELARKLMTLGVAGFLARMYSRSHTKGLPRSESARLTRVRSV